MSKRDWCAYRRLCLKSQIRIKCLKPRRRVALLGLVFAASLSAVEPTVTKVRAPEPIAITVARYLTEVDSLRFANHIPGLAVAIVNGKQIVAVQGLGYADVEAQTPVTVDTPFNIASVAKPIAAVIALHLVEQGLLNLDLPMTNYTGFAEFQREVRAQGGLFFKDYGGDETHSLTLRHVLAMQVNGIPGTRFYYNPPSYSWAARPMAEVAKAPFSELTRQLVFIPAGMTRSARIHRKLPLASPLAESLAKPWHWENDHYILSPPPAPQGDGAAGGVISTARDLARFDLALTENKLITEASRQLMWTPGRAPDGRVLPYGLGWYVQDFRGEKIMWHSGLWEGAYSALYLKIPRLQLTLILLANSEGLRWDNALDEAAVERSPFAKAFLDLFIRGR